MGEGLRRGASSLTSFARGPVLAVLGPVSLHHLPFAVVPTDGEGDAEDVVARLDDAQDAPHSVPLLLGGFAGLEVLHQLVLHDGDAAVEEALDHLEEVGVVGLVCRVGIVADPHEGRGRRQSRVDAAGGQGSARGAAQQLPEVAVHDCCVQTNRGREKSVTVSGRWMEGGRGRQQDEGR